MLYIAQDLTQYDPMSKYRLAPKLENIKKNLSHITLHGSSVLSVPSATNSLRTYAVVLSAFAKIVSVLLAYCILKKCI